HDVERVRRLERAQAPRAPREKADDERDAQEAHAHRSAIGRMNPATPFGVRHTASTSCRGAALRYPVATSWAVGAATTLGLVVAAGFSPAGLGLVLGPSLLLALAVAVALGTWAYAIAMAAHGSKGALVALLPVELGGAGDDGHRR